MRDDARMGWASRELAIVAREVDRWPAWMRAAACARPVSNTGQPDENRMKNTNRGGAAPTARPTAQEVDAPMQTQRTFSRWYWFKWRLAERFFPVPSAVTAAWYAQDCPYDRAFARPSLTRKQRVQWSVSKWLRESKTWCGDA